MDRTELEAALTAADELLSADRVAPLATFETPNGPLTLLVTDRLRNRCRRERKWRSRALFSALEHAQDGFDPATPRTGLQGLFRVDREHGRESRMIDKLYPKFLDKPDELVAMLEEGLGTKRTRWTGVRLVHEPLRLLGFFVPGSPNQVVLVDLDIVR